MKLEKTMVTKILLLILFLTLLILTPFISTSMRSFYLYFLLNLLIIVLGIEAGFLSSISKPIDESKKLASVIKEAYNTPSFITNITIQPVVTKPVVTNSTTKKEVSNNVLKRCKSRPSIFFIESYQLENEESKEKTEKELNVDEACVKSVVKEEELSKQELFMKAENFIGNFYKQLKMQKENSWQKLHGLYQKAF